MYYQNVREGLFLRRPNRFIAHCLVEGEEVIAHVPNTGRCGELLIPGRRVWLTWHPEPGRKTHYTLVTVDKDGLLVNIDSQAPNRIVAESLENGALELPERKIVSVRREVTFGESRLDFVAGDADGGRTLMEVKGVTLEEGGLCRFPDAPTLRGLRHVRELTRAAEKGEQCAVVFVIQMEGMREFRPNDDTQPEFGKALAEARKAGVLLLAQQCHVTPEKVTLAKRVPIALQ